MSTRRILIVGAITVAALVLASRVPTLRRLVLNRPRAPSPVTAGVEGPLVLEGF